MNELNLNLVLIPHTIHMAMKTRGICPEGLARGSRAEHEKLSLTERAQLLACQSFQPFKKALGETGRLNTAWADYREDELQATVYEVMRLADTEGIVTSMADQFAGQSDDAKCIEVIDMAPNVVAVIFGPGSVEALRKDNNVLTLLQSVMQKFLVYGTLDQIMASMVGGVATRLLAVSAFANPTSRPPVPVYR